MESAIQISGWLEEHHNLEECVLEDVRWQRYGTVIDLAFDYIWSNDLIVRSEDTCVTKTLRFHVVQEFVLFNGLTADTSLRPAALNWGISEVAIVQLVRDSQRLEKYGGLPVPVHHLVCLWEGERRIDVVFSVLEILEEGSKTYPTRK